MEKKFYREKNAQSISGAEIIAPSKDEKENLLIQKLEEKATHINVIHDEILRNEYLKKKGKLEQAKTMPKEEIEKALALRLSADILQLTFDLSKIYRSRVQLVNTDKTSISADDIQKELVWCCDKLRTKKHKDKILDVIIHLLFNYIDDFGISMEEVETERKLIEEKEGSYYNGLIVKK